MNVGDLKYLLSKFSDDQAVVFTGFSKVDGGGIHQFVVETSEMGFDDVKAEAWPTRESPPVCMIVIPEELVTALESWEA